MSFVAHYCLACRAQFIREFGELGVDHRGEEGGLVGEVAIGGAGGDADRACGLTQAEPLGPTRINPCGGLAQQGSAQIAVVVRGAVLRCRQCSLRMVM
jgi:hypothetical protein